MKKVGTIFALLLYFAMMANSQAAVWVKLHEDGTSKLMLDKQSVLQQDLLKRAWVKIEYKATQKTFQTPDNLQSRDKQFNLSKLLWFFDCTAQKAATSQVFQYYNNELVYSAGIEPKSAEFIEPVPETDVDFAMRYVCLTDRPATNASKAKPAATKVGSVKVESAKTPTPTAEPAAVPAVEKPAPVVAPAKAVEKPKEVAALTKSATGKASARQPHWTYEGKEGPESWAKLSPEYATCETGRNQSPVAIEETTHAVLKPIRSIQKFPAKDIVNNGHTVQVSFKEGNMLVLDNAAYQMKQVHFHAPSENKVHGKSYPLEAHFVHADSKGNLTVIGVMFKEGKENAGLAKLWPQMPNEEGAPIPLKARVIPTELMPDNRSYYRFSGSLTTPPCTEGVRWILLKTPVTASKEQIELFERATRHHNNRPVQALNGRVILE